MPTTNLHALLQFLHYAEDAGMMTQLGPSEVVNDTESGRGSLIRWPVRPRLLLVEDDADNNELFSRLLESAGYEVDGCSNGAEGLERARAFRYDAIVTDVCMPKMSGIEMASAYRSYELERSLPAVPIVSITANPLETTRLECLRVGMSVVLTKPFRASDLERALARRVDFRPRVLVVGAAQGTHARVRSTLDDASRFETVRADRVDEIAAIVRSTRIDAVTLDVGDDVLSSAAVVDGLRGRVGRLPITWIAVTDSSSLQVRRTCLGSGFDEVLSPSFDHA